MVHLSMVTIGILIALGLEQSVEAYHNHHVAREARANMLSELADNKKQLDNHLGDIARMQKDRQNGVAVVGQLLAHKHLKDLRIEVGYSGPTLNSTSWTTASTVGALVYMEYLDVKRFAEVYKIQDFYEHLQNDEIKDVEVALGLLNSLEDDPEKVPDDELRAIKRQLLQSEAALTVIEQLGHQLSNEYGKVLPKS